MLHVRAEIPRFARDFACGLKRPQSGSTSTLPCSLRSQGAAQDDKGVSVIGEENSISLQNDLQ